MLESSVLFLNITWYRPALTLRALFNKDHSSIVFMKELSWCSNELVSHMQGVPMPRGLSYMWGTLYAELVIC